MARAATDSIPATRAGTAKQCHSTAAVSAHTTGFTAASASSSRTPHCRFIAWRCVRIHVLTLRLHTYHTQCWKDNFFDRTSLHSLGYTCHLGHDGDVCPADSPYRQLTIIDINGWHKVRVRFCKCGAGGISHEHYRQLLRMEWYPASFNRPKTAFTFDLLETYHKVTLQGKLNLYDFYHAIVQKSDNQGRSKPLVSGFKWLK